MKEWLKKLLSDYGGNPSTRLFLAFGCFIVLAIYTFVNKDPKSEVLWALISGMSAMSGLSVIDKSSIKNETKDNNS